jgi:hypothetical protein
MRVGLRSGEVVKGDVGCLDQMFCDELRQEDSRPFRDPSPSLCLAARCIRWRPADICRRMAGSNAQKVLVRSQDASYPASYQQSSPLQAPSAASGSLGDVNATETNR